MPSPFYLAGPTATGKTSLAVEIAARAGAEIVGADAFQVYAGLDLLTAKPSADERQRVPYHLVGVVPLATEYNVGRFLAAASRCLEEIAARGRPALVVGGSGLYLRALTHGLSPLPPTRPELRAELEHWDLASLVTRLKTVDASALDLVDARNKRRLIRAIEICESTGKPLSISRTLSQHPLISAGNGFLLTRDRVELHTRIQRRVAALQSGDVLDEVRRQEKTAFSSTSAKIIGLSGLLACVRGQIDLAPCLASIEVATRQYAKRQSTWFRGKSDFTSVNLSTASEEEVIERAVSLIRAD